MNPNARIMVVVAGLLGLAMGVLWYQRCSTSCTKHSRWAGRAATLVSWCALGLALIVVPAAWFLPDRAAGPPSDPLAQSVTATRPAAPDEQVAKHPAADSQPQIVGVWADNYQGKRTMTLRPDGTGTMEVELTGLTATLFAQRLRFDMLWSTEDGKLVKESIGGEPSDKVELILQTMGRRVEESILELTEEQLRTLDPDGVTTYVWRRVR